MDRFCQLLCLKNYSLEDNQTFPAAPNEHIEHESKWKKLFTLFSWVFVIYFEIFIYIRCFGVFLPTSIS